MSDWKDIETAPEKKPILLIGPKWEHAEIGAKYPDGACCEFITGMELYPEPTHW